jgi:hypothetical protein
LPREQIIPNQVELSMQNTLNSEELRLMNAGLMLDTAGEELARSPKDTLKILARAVAARSPDALNVALRSMRKYRYTFGRYPNILAPKTFNEKVQARKIFDRRPVLSQWVDKFAVRDYVVTKSTLGALPQIYHVTTDARDIPFERLPSRYVVKASHGSGWLQIVRDNTRLDRAELVRKCGEWLSMNYFDQSLELVYKNIKPRIIIEELLDNGHGEVPYDYKLYVFGGKVRFIQVDVSRFGLHRRKIYDPDWNVIPVQLTVETYDGRLEKPRLLKQMIRFAEQLSGGIDFVRVDLYEVGDRVYFGEMTPTSGNGFNRFNPESYDELFGSFWEMQPRINPDLSRAWPLWPGLARQQEFDRSVLAHIPPR